MHAHSGVPLNLSTPRIHEGSIHSKNCPPTAGACISAKSKLVRVFAEASDFVRTLSSLRSNPRNTGSSINGAMKHINARVDQLSAGIVKPRH